MEKLLVIGGTSKVGLSLVPAATATRSVRVATRDPGSAAARTLVAAGAQLVRADLREAVTLAPAFDGVTQLVLAAHGFPGKGDNDVASVDRAGHLAAIEAAKRAGVRRVVYISALGAGPNVPVDLFRVKWEIEQALASSGLAWTSLRAAAFMEFWATLVGEPVLKRGRTLVFGAGNNPINFVSAADVATLSLTLLDDPRAVGRIVELGGPENVTMNDVARRFGSAIGIAPKIHHVPVAVMKAALATVGRLAAPIGRQLAAGILMDTAPMGFDPGPTLNEWPMELTSLQRIIDERASQHTAR